MLVFEEKLLALQIKVTLQCTPNFKYKPWQPNLSVYLQKAEAFRDSHGTNGGSIDSAGSLFRLAKYHGKHFVSSI